MESAKKKSERYGPLTRSLNGYASLREGLDETLTVLRFGLPHGLMRTLATTNPIEFLNGRIRKTTHNVTRWDGTMVLRWVALALDEASKTFRKLRSHQGMPKLVAALRACDTPVCVARTGVLDVRPR
jgi:transposase-like protein